MNIKTIEKIELNENTAYLAGVIVGDGHISNHLKSKNSLDYNIRVELIDHEYLLLISNLIKGIISTKSTVKSANKRKGKQQSFYFQIRNKSIYYFLTKDLGIPAGKKCYSVLVPDKIFSSIPLQKCFLAGLFDTDGGIRSNSIGFTSASKGLITGIIAILNNLNFEHKVEEWINKKNNITYYGIKLGLKQRDKFLKQIPLQNQEKLEKICGRARAVKWDRQPLRLIQA